MIKIYIKKYYINVTLYLYSFYKSSIYISNIYYILYYLAIISNIYKNLYFIIIFYLSMEIMKFCFKNDSKWLQYIILTIMHSKKKEKKYLYKEN